MNASWNVLPALFETVERPWGSYTVVDEGSRHKTKRLTVSVGARLSYQRHEHRDEHWFVVAGNGEAVLDGSLVPLSRGESLDVPRGCAHRITNQSSDELILVEVQTGTYFGEDDIERLQDDYDRAPRPE